MLPKPNLYVVMNQKGLMPRLRVYPLVWESETKYSVFIDLKHGKFRKSLRKGELGRVYCNTEHEALQVLLDSLADHREWLIKEVLKIDALDETGTETLLSFCRREETAVETVQQRADYRYEEL
jgi:hypothetical protein